MAIPAPAYETAYPETVVLRDRATGTAVVDLRHVPLKAHRWPTDGGVEMDFYFDLTARVAPDLLTFTGNKGSGLAQPIAALRDWIMHHQPPPAPMVISATPKSPSQGRAELVVAAMLVALAVTVALL